MNDALSAFAMLTATLRTVLLVGGIALAGIAALDWGVRTRRINPFSGIARFMRGRVEPRLAGIERSVTRAGGHPSTTPWWALVAYAVFGALLLAGVDVVANALLEASVMTSRGPIGYLVLAERWGFAFLRIALLLRVVGSWVPSLARTRWLSWTFGATEWMLRPLRGLIPSLGMIDISPIVAYFALQLTQWLLESILMSGAR
jgi:YggT family protein